MLTQRSRMGVEREAQEGDDVTSSAPRHDSTEPRPRGCSVLGEPPQALPSF